MGLARAALVLASLGAGWALQPASRAPDPAPLGRALLRRGGVRPADVALLLRGGVQPAEGPFVGDAALPSGKPKSALKRRPTASRRPSSLRDATTAALCLAAVGAAQAGSVPFMAAVPRPMQSVAWLAFGSAFSAALWLLVLLSNYERAVAVNRAVSALLLGAGGSTARCGPALAVASALGCAASFQTLPASAG